MKKIFLSLFSLTFLFLSAIPALPSVATEDQLSNEVTVEDQTVVSSSDMLQFVLDVRWGNVEGEVTNKDETIFDGSVSVPSGDHVSFRQKLLFEENDSITNKLDSVSWKSFIYGHWDGVRVLVSAKASDVVTITTNQGTLTKTAQELFQAGSPITQDVGNDREIIVHVRPFEKRGFFLAMGWGLTNRDAVAVDSTLEQTYPVLNFSGSVTLGGGSLLQLVKPVRFEKNDAITSRTKTSVAWTSVIRGGVDGLLLRLHPDRAVNASDALTVSFTNLNFSQSFTLIDLFHSKVTRVSITVDGQTGYELIFRVVRHPNGKLLRARNDSKVWFIEGDLKRHVISADAFKRAGLKWEDVEIVSEEVIGIYPTGDKFGYEDRTLIKGSAPRVYVLSEGKRRLIASPEAFARLGYKWENITQIPDVDVAQYPEGNVISESSDAPEGSLIRVEGSPTVYQVKGGKRLPIPSLAVFSGNKFGWEDVMVIKQEVRDKFPQGKSVGYPDGTLLVGDDGKINVISNGERQWIRTADAFIGRGYDWGQIQRVSNTEISAYDKGADLELADL